MAENRGDAASASFVRALHRALLGLYDPTALAKSPLLDLLGAKHRPDPAAALRQALLQAVEALKPGDAVPIQSEAWRIYRILQYRYVEQIPQQEIAASLALSVRQLRRHEKAALQALGNYLWSHHGLGLRVDAPLGEAAESPAAALGSHSGELRWLQESFASEPADIAEIVAAAHKTVAPLLQAAQVRVACTLPPGLPRLAVQTITMRQALVSILTVAARLAPGGRIAIHASHGPTEIGIRIQAARGRPLPRALGGEERESLDMARRLVALSGGTLELRLDTPELPLEATLTLPVAQQLGVLVIDDNLDTLQLFQRYLEGTRYTFVGARDPAQALALAQEVAPKIVILDVMLPGMDGWEVLGRLREHPATRGTAVIVCTILPQERLALTLGAAACLRKPVSRAALLEALDALAGRALPAAR